MPTPAPLRLNGLRLNGQDPDGTRPLLLDIPVLDIAPGAMVGVQGPSGAGKSTLLAVIAGLAVPQEGEVLWGETRVSRLPEGKRDVWRRQTIGFVFQNFHLIGELSAIDNVLLPLRFFTWSARGWCERAEALLASVGLGAPHRPCAVLSRGEQQRVALARALLLNPPLILADEPTASLDAENAVAVADLLLAHARKSGATLIVASHDAALLARLPQRLVLAGGRLREGA